MVQVTETAQDNGDWIIKYIGTVLVLCWDLSPVILILWNIFRCLLYCLSDYSTGENAGYHIRYFLGIVLLAIRIFFWNSDSLSLDIWDKLLELLS